MPLASMRDRNTRPTSMRLAAGGGASLSRAGSRNVSPIESYPYPYPYPDP
jgi:hypothetical protein